MDLRRMIAGCGLALAVIGLSCGASDGSSARSTSQAPAWLVLRLEAVRVAPYKPGTHGTWDGPVPEPNDGAVCGFLGLAAGVITSNPVIGKGAQLVCQIDSRPTQREQEPSSPDL